MTLPIVVGISGFLATKIINTASFYAGDTRCPEIATKAINKIKRSLFTLEQKRPFLVKSLVFFKNYLGPIAFLTTAIYVNNLVLSFLATGVVAAGAIGLIWEGYDLIKKIIQTKETIESKEIGQFTEFVKEFQIYQKPKLLQENKLIPDVYINDAVLGKNICPITNCPIRHPVVDPTSNTVYEQEAIVSWVVSNRTSPLSREPLTVEQLLQAPEIEEEINKHLTFLNLHIN